MPQLNQQSKVFRWFTPCFALHIICVISTSQIPPIESTTCMIKAENGECNSNPTHMLKHCEKECYETNDFATFGFFNIENDRLKQNPLKCIDIYDVGNEDEDEPCENLAAMGRCASDPGFMLFQCAKSCLVCGEPNEKIFPIGVRQEIHPDDIGDEVAIQKTTTVIKDTFSYMNMIMTEPDFASVRSICRNNDEYCAALASDGACKAPENYEQMKEENDESLEVQLYEFMISECAPACQICEDFVSQEHMEIVSNCIYDSKSSILGPGGLNQMFERIVGESEEGEVVAPKSKIQIHSRPTYPKGYKRSRDPPDFIVGGPWVVTIDDFLTEEECMQFISIGHERGYERSTLEEEKDYTEEEKAKEVEGGDDAYRTSTNTWCEDTCYEDPVAQKILEKLTNATGFPDSNAEYLQMLRYEEGQYYKSHHDIGGEEYYEPSGPRIFTFFLYLSDVIEGGATRLNDLSGIGDGLTIDVQPKRGRALIWPNVLDGDPLQLDKRTYHEALVVEKGTKYGANAWFYLRDFKGDNCDYEALNSLSEEDLSTDEYHEEL